MRRNIVFTGIFCFFIITNAFAVKFTITGEAFNWLNLSPASGSRVYVDEPLDYNFKTEPLEGVRIKILYGSTFYQVDTTKPKVLEPIIYSDKDGKFTFIGKLDTTQTKRLAIVVDKDGYLGFFKTLNFDENKTEYHVMIYMVPKMTAPKK